MKYYLGVDLGSISLNTVVLNEKREIVKNLYTYCHGRPFHVLRSLLSDLDNEGISFSFQAFTGSGGELAAELVGGRYVNEVVSQSTAVACLYPNAVTVIEMGGEDSKLILMDKKEGEEKSRLADFAMNSICAAGTGSFLDQQARRIGISVENEFGQLALQSVSPPRIAGRCSVFAKSDMIHLQQIATPVEDIVAGLCFAVARNFKSCLARGKKLLPPVLFQGGVAANQGMVRAFREILEIDEHQLTVPEYYASMGAIGAVYHCLDANVDGQASFKGLEALDEYLISTTASERSLDPLSEPTSTAWKPVASIEDETEKVGVYLGLDVGSLSTNIVIIDKDDNVLARRYLPTASKPLEAIRKGMQSIYEEVGDNIEVLGAGTTGSGRYLTGDFIGADTIQNEITAQATAAIAIDPEVDTIFEIGGQDSKFISIDNGVVVDFEMNKVCAAGTGSFLEEQAEKLDINIVEDFQNLALESKSPSKLGDRCTVFMESDLNSHQQKGVEKNNLIAGLAYSIVHNYIQKVVGSKRIGNRILFQGGVTNNKSVVAAFEKITGKPIVVPPNFDVTGAIGAAMLARKAVSGSTRFKGFEISNTPYTLDKFTCKSCSNQCEIRRVTIEGEKKPLFFGGRCEKWEVDDRKGKGKGIPNLFEKRLELLMGDYQEEPEDSRPTIGIPRCLMVFYQQFPLWRKFFEELGFRVVLSRPSDRVLVTKSLEMLSAETCFPIEVMHGHIHDLLDKNVDYVFAPFLITTEGSESNPTLNYNCPWIQSYPFMIKGALKDDPRSDKLLIPPVHFRFGLKVASKQLGDYLKERIGISKKATSRALRLGVEQQHSFEDLLRRTGEEILPNLPSDKTQLVILSRPYNGSDPELNLHLVEKLSNLSAIAIPIDFLPLEVDEIFDDYPMMYWPNGQKIIAASRYVADHETLNAVYLGNFRCGPDSFILHYVRDEMKEKPFLQLEVDEHGADAGLITRCEAFLDSLEGYKKSEAAKQQQAAPPVINRSSDLEGRTLYYPYMCDHVYTLAAASRHCGMPSEVLPMQDGSDIELGRKYTSSRECFPMIATTGSFLKKITEPGFQPEKASFFMPSHNGPCRFGQYHKLQQNIFDHLGFHDVTIVSPSNENAYAGTSSDGNATQYRMLAYKGVIAVDLLRKLLQETRPYETTPETTNRIYKHWLDAVVNSVEAGGEDLADTMEQAGKAFTEIETDRSVRKPIVAIVGEIFMRDNPYCSGFLVDRLEALGAETAMAPVREWVLYSTYRYWRDSLWKRDWKGLAKSKIQELFQTKAVNTFEETVHDVVDGNLDVTIKDMLTSCGTYIHKHYDGDPPIAVGTAALLAERGASGIVNLLPFTCMPGTLITSISGAFREDNNNIPWVNISYDGQDDTGIEIRLQAFMHQAKEFCAANNFDAILSGQK